MQSRLHEVELHIDWILVFGSAWILVIRQKLLYDFKFFYEITILWHFPQFLTVLLSRWLVQLAPNLLKGQ